MIPLSSSMLLMTLIGSAIAVLAMMRVFTNIIGHETELHDLRNRVKKLQYEQQLYLARLQGQIAQESDVDILDEDDPIEAVELASEAAREVEHAIDAQPVHSHAA